DHPAHLALLSGLLRDLLLECRRAFELVEHAIVLCLLRRRRRGVLVVLRLRRRRARVASVRPGVLSAVVSASSAARVARVSAVASAAGVAAVVARVVAAAVALPGVAAARVGAGVSTAVVLLVLDAHERDRAVPRRVTPDLVARVDHARRERQRLVVRLHRLLVLA